MDHPGEIVSLVCNVVRCCLVTRRPYVNYCLYRVPLLGLSWHLMPIFTSLVRRCFTMAAGESSLSGIYSMAFVTVPDMDVGKKLAAGIVKSKLAACVNIIPQVTSVYEWEDKINEDSELILMIKTRTSRIDELSKYVRENHPYDCAEVISSLIDNGNPPYLNWIGEIVKPKN